MEPDRPLSSDEEEDAPLFAGLPAAGPARRMGNRIGLQDFLQLIVAGGGAELRAAANNNEELVQHLWRGGTIKSPAVKRALLACRRDMFMPENYTEDAFIDAPVRVEELGFNISAPHIHATALEALELQEGDTLLDVGCGCGLLSAAAAQLVGPGGQVKAIDIRPACLDLSQRAVARLREEDTDYAEASCTIQWKLQNVFIPSADHMGKYSKVYVGAACPRDRLRDVLKLLRPEGGLLLVPVDSQLLLFKKAADGKLGRKTLSSVRFSELEVPRDVEVVLAVMKDDMDRARHIQVPPSSLAQDLAALSPSPTPATPPDLRQGVQGQAARQARDALGRLAPSGDQAMEEGGDETAPASGVDEARPPELAGTPKRHKPEPGLVRQPSYLQVLPDGLAHLGLPDCYLHGVDEPPPDTGGSSGQEGGVAGAGGPAHSQAGSGSGWGKVWRLPAHRAVLQARCEHFRARFLSGMRDAQEDALAAPEGVSAAAVRALLHYVYQDRGVQELQLPLEQVTEVLHVAVFYGCPRLISLCEQRLADVLATPEEGAEEAAAQLLALAEEVGGLPQLRTLALAYIVDNYPAVSRSDSYKQLPRPLVDLIAEQACAHANRMLASLKGLAGIKPANNDTGGPGMAGLASFVRPQRYGVDAAADDSEDLDF